ncbi:RNA-binding protein nob1, putative isoform 2 [Hibiscus syriacus]|uniref:RNA-binding protein nob1, putative isoform 2 n=1 Tax=Hibiscus syriacus TaxID=106335 RepID=A0A6A3BQY7_HIBSY|nr:RNA-binding protein NOB1 [Hibiscus syriacus]KAE8717502.1 RNA-binding protein nob1, putative isoform 2 [Hibiscus syriacus]
MEDSVAPNSNPAPCWSNLLKSQPPKPQSHNQTTPPTQLFVESCKSTKGIAVAVVDANAIIEGGEKLNNTADKFVTVPEVLAEIRDPVSRRRLAFIPFTIDSLEPSPDALNKVIKFSRATGDLQTLSDVDLKLIALTYMLESQIHGTNHLRDAPPPVHVVNVKRLPERDLPGWGSNVPNPEEWEALDRETGDGSNSNSRILPLKDLNMNIVSSDNHSEDGLAETKGETHSENIEDSDQGFRRPRRYLPQKKEVKIEGKKMVADGIDASQGQFDNDGDDWLPAVSRSTHRRFLRRKARREYNEALVEKDCQEDMEKSTDEYNVEDASGPDQLLQQSAEDVCRGNGISEEAEKTEIEKGGEDLSSILKQMRLEEDSARTLQEENEAETAMEEAVSDDNVNLAVEGDGEELDQLEISSQTNETVDASDDVSSEQSWMLRSLSESTVACVTGDFAMQNVLLQMGLRLLAPGGMQIRQLHRWVLKCHACYTVTAEIGRIFCPKCGNGGTLRKVAVTVGENGIVLASHRPRITLRGTKFSLPLPQGGRDAITKNLILREDQLPQKLLYPKTKKKVSKQGDNDLLMAGDTFTHHTDKRAPLQPPVRKALAVFSGKRNPNDNHYSRSKH